MDESIQAPATLGDSISTLLESAALVEGLTAEEKAASPSRIRLYLSMGAAAVLAILIGLSVAWKPEPRDTFDNPEDAYAYLVATLSKMSSAMDAGVQAVDNCTQMLTLPSKILDDASGKQ